MSNFINNTQNNFTLIQNEVLNSKEMTFELKGIYCFLISKPSGWSFSAERIASQTNDKIGTIKRLLRELEDMELLVRTKVKSDKGKFCGIKYEILQTIVTKRDDGYCVGTQRDDGYRDNISNTNNNSNTNSSNTNKDILSEIKISNDNPLLIDLDVTNEKLEVKITKSLFDLFRRNQIEQGVTVFKRYDRTRLNSWLTHIDKMIRIDKVTREELQSAYVWLSDGKYKNSEFWRKNILSTEKLREQYPKLQIAMKEDLQRSIAPKNERTQSRLGL